MVNYSKIEVMFLLIKIINGNETILLMYVLSIDLLQLRRLRKNDKRLILCQILLTKNILQ